MAHEQSHEELLKGVLEQVVRNNRQMRPGTPMAELKMAIEAGLTALPPLKFDEVTQAVGDANAAATLVERAPEIIGWNADQLVEWVEELARKA